MQQSGTFLCHHKNFIKSENSTVIFLQVWRPANHSYELHVKPQIMAPLIAWLWRSIVLRVIFFKVIIIQKLYCRFRVSKYAWVSKRRLQNIMGMIIIMMITIIISPPLSSSSWRRHLSACVSHAGFISFELISARSASVYKRPCKQFSCTLLIHQWGWNYSNQEEYL